jgi:hypothetical protein
VADGAEEDRVGAPAQFARRRRIRRTLGFERLHADFSRYEIQVRPHHAARGLQRR